jgi:hypothetical protein
MNEDDVAKRLRHAHFLGSVPDGHQAASDRASDEDRRYFERHPDRHARLRALIPGEFGPLVDEATVFLVRVDKARGDTRLRSTISRARGLS